MTMGEQDRRGAAFHEAGHAVVAWAVGLEVGEIAIGVNGDDAAGKSEIEESHHLPIVDQLAVCLAGVEAQELFGCPTHDLAGMSDFAKVIELVEDGIPEGESKRVRDAGSARARGLLIEYREHVRRLAEAVVVRGKIDAASYLSQVRAAPRPA